LEWVKRIPNPGGEMNETSEIEIRPVYEAADFGDNLTPELRDREAELRAKVARNS
jgi:hypothetical protein